MVGVSKTVFFVGACSVLTVVSAVSTDDVHMPDGVVGAVRLDPTREAKCCVTRSRFEKEDGQGGVKTDCVDFFNYGGRGGWGWSRYDRQRSLDRRVDSAYTKKHTNQPGFEWCTNAELDQAIKKLDDAEADARFWFWLMVSLMFFTAIALCVLFSLLAKRRKQEEQRLHKLWLQRTCNLQAGARGAAPAPTRGEDSVVVQGKRLSRSAQAGRRSRTSSPGGETSTDEVDAPKRFPSV